MSTIARGKPKRAPKTHASSLLEGRTVCGAPPKNIDDAFPSCKRCQKAIAIIIEASRV